MGCGYNLSTLARATQEFLQQADGKITYGEFLRQRFPYNPRPVDIPNYKADHGEKAGLADDMVGIRGEVDAFAYLLASREMKPPLAVGLFGDWGSGDYRKHLGIPALIQKDFRQLASLVGQQNEAILEDKEGKLEQSKGCFNRIILYIDDLDRCPDQHVVEVLQAVHLLLAFELFVVVVAVDSRWLSHALTKHFGALVVDRENAQEATPDDYLEKIFQIPFWIRPLSKTAKQNIIQGLLQGHVALAKLKAWKRWKRNGRSLVSHRPRCWQRSPPLAAGRRLKPRRYRLRIVSSTSWTDWQVSSAPRRGRPNVS
ncbi:MAG: P-loop NTPase fold protein [Candidatus Thiodiazotropha sp.]